MKLPNKLSEQIWSVKRSRKSLAASGLLATTLLASCSDGREIVLNPQKQSASFSITYQGHKSGAQDFHADIAIKKVDDSTFVIKIDEDGFWNDCEYKGSNPDELLDQVAQQFSDRIPLNTQEGQEKMRARISDKIEFVAEKYQEMLENPDDQTKEIKITYTNPEEAN